MKSAALFLATGGAMILYFQYEKARLERKRIVEMSKGYGKPKVGGPFKLQDLSGIEFTEKDLLGKYSLVGTIWAEASPLSLSWSISR
jgi:protein SCO1